MFDKDQLMDRNADDIEKRTRRWLKLLPAIMILTGSFALSKDTGIWVAIGPVAQLNIGCSQVWECRTKQDIVHSSDTYIWHTPNKLTLGVCNAAGGPADGCNECAASPPPDPCEWELRKTGH